MFDAKVERFVWIVRVFNVLFLLVAAVQNDEDDNGAAYGDATMMLEFVQRCIAMMYAYTAPRTMGSVWVLAEFVGFWHIEELLPGWQVLDDLATNVLVILWKTAVPYLAAFCTLLESDRGRSWPSCAG